MLDYLLLQLFLLSCLSQLLVVRFRRFLDLEHQLVALVLQHPVHCSLVITLTSRHLSDLSADVFALLPVFLYELFEIFDILLVQGLSHLFIEFLGVVLLTQTGRMELAIEFVMVLIDGGCLGLFRRVIPLRQGSAGVGLVVRQARAGRVVRERY